MRLIMMAAAAVLLASCASAPAPKANPPAPAVIEVPVHVYVPIASELTKRCTWPRTGKPSQAMEVANKRKECLGKYEAQLDRIELVQGKPAATSQP
ncbi:hypothetical protein A7A76_07750 [Lysobacter enzymogenes]|uniref:hypothetical protein n=1 Tax=Lysobacter enzymogenes TaxID=69 RepID=UPI0019D0D47D|nr:hypothetical protein [Lysobacter enzymogenes]MBN7138987.1 hypothetical protein [Lysobacter enzymogenes]